MVLGLEGERKLAITACSSVKYPKKSKPGPLNPNWKGGPVRKKCLRCGSEFLVRPCRGDLAKYCTLSCFNLFQSEEKMDWWKIKNPDKEIRPTSVVKGTRRVVYDVRKCLWCECKFEVRPSILNKLCSPECHKRWAKWRSSGRRNPAWKGGKSLEPYPFNWNEISRTILARDGRKCQNPFCDRTRKHVDAHHIDYNKANCSEKNLITLCDKCHSTANFNRSRWLDYYRAIQTQRKIRGRIGIKPRMQRLIGWNKGEKHPLAKLTASDVSAIRVRLSNGERGRKLSTEFGVSEATISIIKHNKIWQEQHVLP